MAAAIGIGIDVEEPMGNMIIDIGGGTSEIAVIALGGIVCDKSIRVAGDDFTKDIEEYMRRQHNILVGERTAEEIKINVGAAVSGAVASVKSFFGMGTSGNDLAKYVRVKDSSVDLNGLNPQLKERFAALAKEYNEKTGKKIQVNSGYRSPEEQAALYAKLGPPKAAPPGRSRHESGLAIDINSPDAYLNDENLQD